MKAKKKKKNILAKILEQIKRSLHYSGTTFFAEKWKCVMGTIFFYTIIEFAFKQKFNPLHTPRNYKDICKCIYVYIYIYTHTLGARFLLSFICSNSPHPR